MIMIIIGLLMIFGAFFLLLPYCFGYGESAGFLILLIPMTLFIVGGLILVAFGIKSVGDKKNNTAKKKDTETRIVDKEVLSEEQIITQIREYKKLADEGIISEAEFEEKKRQLLS